MPYSREELYATIAPRPRKVAFLINPNNCPDALLDSIYEFNMSHWGGRYNPIIPVVNSKINDSYWALKANRALNCDYFITGEEIAK